jgi:type I restriction enzyme S subunit
MGKKYPVKNLASVCLKITDGSHFSPDMASAGYPYITVRDINDDKIDFSNCKFVSKDDYEALKKNGCAPKYGDLLFSKDGTVGKVAIVDTNEQFVVLSSLAIITPDETQISSDFLFYVLKSPAFLQEAIGRKTGAAIRRIILKHLKSIEFPLPPLHVQKAIVAKLDAAFASIDIAIAASEQNAENAKQLFQSYLSDVFEKLKNHSQPKSLCDLTERITKGSSPKWQGISYTTEPGILFVTSENIGVNSLLLDKRKFVEEAFNQKDKKSILKKGDVLTNIVGASIGRTAVFELDDVANINQAVCLIRCKPELLNSYYLSYLLNSPEYVYILHDNEVDNARANLSLGFFSKLEIQLPSKPLQEQTVALIRKAEQEFELLSSVYENKSNQLAKLKQSLLQQAFNGQLVDA